MSTLAPSGERLEDIIRGMVHGGVNARRQLSSGLIITYITPDPDTSREQWRYSLTAARVGAWPDDEELRIVRTCLGKAWRKHPLAVVYDESERIKKKQGVQGGRALGTFTMVWRQWPVRDVFSAPAGLQAVLRAALGRR